MTESDKSAKTTALEVQRRHAEEQYAEELTELKAADERQKPPNWKLSPWAVLQYLMGGKLKNGFEITPKYIGNSRPHHR